MTITRSNLFFCLLPDIFFPYLSTKFPSSTYSRVVAAPTLSHISSKISWNVPGQSLVRDANGHLAKMKIFFVVAHPGRDHAHEPARFATER